MEKIRSIGLYVVCILCGIYTADMVFRFIRYISVFTKGDTFAKTVMFTGTVLLDGASFMIISAVCALLLAVCGFAFRMPGKITAFAFIVNFLSSTVFMVSASITDIALNTLLYISVISVPLYLLSGLWCIYFSIKDLCIYFLNSTKETNK